MPRKILLLILIFAILALSCAASFDLEKTIDKNDGKPHVNGEPTSTPKPRQMNYAVPAPMPMEASG